MLARIEVVLFEAFGREARFGQVGLVDVERVVEAFEYVVGDFYAGFAQILAVGDGLAVEGFRLADEGVAGGQAAVVGLAGGRGVGRYPAGSVQDAEVLLPAVVVALGVPDLVVVVARGFGVAVVEHGVEGHLVGDADFAAVAGEDAERRGQAAARAFAADEDLVGADAELVGVLDHPFQRGVAVFDGGRVGVFVGEPVARRHDHGPVFAHEFFGPSDPFCHGFHPGDVAAAVDPEDSGAELLRRIFPCLALFFAADVQQFALHLAVLSLELALFFAFFGRQDEDPHLFVIRTGDPIRARTHLRTGSDRQAHHQADYG